MLIGVDIDEVLEDTLAHVLKNHNSINCIELRKGQFEDNRWWKVLAGEGYSSRDLIDRYMVEKGLEIEPIPGAVEGIERLAMKHDLVAVTARYSYYADVTKELIQNHFGDNILHVYSLTQSNGVEIPKSKICSQLKFDLMIDDQLSQALACAEVCKYGAYLFANYPWNKTNDRLPKNVERVGGWNDLVKRIE